MIRLSVRAKNARLAYEAADKVQSLSYQYSTACWEHYKAMAHLKEGPVYQQAVDAYRQSVTDYQTLYLVSDSLWEGWRLAWEASRIDFLHD